MMSRSFSSEDRIYSGPTCLRICDGVDFCSRLLSTTGSLWNYEKQQRNSLSLSGFLTVPDFSLSE